jgi:hypothetical protein
MCFYWIIVNSKSVDKSYVDLVERRCNKQSAEGGGITDTPASANVSPDPVELDLNKENIPGTPQHKAKKADRKATPESFKSFGLQARFKNQTL